MIHKKGSLPLELLVVVVLLFAFGLMIFLSKNIVDDLNADIQSDSDLSADAKSNSQSLTTRLPTVFDGAFVLIFILLWIGVLVLGYQVDISPAYFVLAIILLLVTVGIAMLIDNAYTDSLTDSDFSDMATSFPMTNFILDKLGVVIAVMGGSLLIVLYGKMNGVSAVGR
jgi:hypothetical protein